MARSSFPVNVLMLSRLVGVDPLLTRGRHICAVIVFERHPHEPIPHPDDRPEAYQEDSEGGRDAAGSAEDQHKDPCDDGRRDQEPSGCASDHSGTHRNGNGGIATVTAPSPTQNLPRGRSERAFSCSQTANPSGAAPARLIDFFV
jgi:hypothetical protein